MQVYQRAALSVATLAFFLCVTIAPSWSEAVRAASLQVAVAPERAADGTLTGDYVAHVSAEEAPGARLACCRLQFPPAYVIDGTKVDIRVQAVQPGDDVTLVDLNTPPTTATTDDTPFVFAEVTPGATATEVAVVALLNDVPQSPKSICRIVFTSRGRPTRESLQFVVDGVVLKSAALDVLSSEGRFSTKPVPLFADLNWDGAIDAADLGIFTRAWRESTAGAYKPLADLAPCTSGVNPAAVTSQGDGKVDKSDHDALIKLWRAYNKQHRH